MKGLKSTHGVRMEKGDMSHCEEKENAPFSFLFSLMLADLPLTCNGLKRTTPECSDIS